MLKWAPHMYLAVLLLSCITLGAMVPPHPMYKDVPATWLPAQPEIRLENDNYSGQSVADFLQEKRENRGKEELPNNILALMVQFSDVQFKTAADYPDYLDHDQEYFERWMLHLQDYFADASHGRYTMDYSVFPQVLTLPKTMAWYGGDTAERIDANLPFILEDLMPLCDDLIDFSEYGGLIIFHAGAGQEADIDGIRTNQIWSTFLTRRVLQASYDPENDDYPGFTTADGAVLTNVVIIPEDQYQDYFPGDGEEDAEMYLFSIYGVLAHQTAHILGLPTLFDNDGSNGRSQGIGNWGLMGTGVWNASGYVPAQLSAWSRYYLGWEDAITVFNDNQELPLDHFLDHQPEAIRLYKIPISDMEYFLVENRQQNPDGSLDPYNSLPSYTFKLLPEGEQEYYELYPELPYFNFMQNRYIGCEWDFFLPGYGMSPLTDGSGILIWHIDENVIAENFTANFDSNRVNADHQHKGVDLEEADGFQHLDTPVADENKYGGPDDSYRAGNNDYFGNSSYQGLTWLPTAESYYGGVPLEIYDISASANRMYFNVRFGWKLDAGFNEINTLPAAAIDLDEDGNPEIFYPMPNGKLALFEDESWAEGYPTQTQPIPHLYTWDGYNLYIPTQSSDLARLYAISRYERLYVLNLPSHRWISHPVDAGNNLFLPLKNEDTQSSGIMSYHKDYPGTAQELISLEADLVGNLSLMDSMLYALAKNTGDSGHQLLEYQIWDNPENLFELKSLEVPADSTVVGIFTARLKDNLNLIVQCPSSLYVFDLLDDAVVLKEGFPFVIADSVSAPITIADIDRNSTLDILWASSNRVYIIDHSGSDLSVASLNLGLAADGISAGVLAMDLDGDARYELAASLSFNRLAVWEENFRLKSSYPISFGERARHLPFVAKGADHNYYLWQATDKGHIYRNELPDYEAVGEQPRWEHEYGNLRRTANYPLTDLPNQYFSDEVFVKAETYIFPNPLKSIYEQRVRLSVMPTRDMEIELKIYDISGKLVYDKSALGYAYLRNMDIFEIPAAKLSSGIYIAMVSGGGKTLQLRFGIEK
jgi:M6 family metalloprotease-like protein